jgi:hypothetical protein
MNSSQANSQSYQFAPNRAINVGETKFVYRKLGPHAGVPVIFLNHDGGAKRSIHSK